MRLRAATSSFWRLTPPRRLVVLTVGAAAFGGVVVAIQRHLERTRLAPLPPAACELVRAHGGEVAGIRYLERLSKGADPSKPLPMLVVFHSRGARPEVYTGWADNLAVPARVIIPYGLERLGDGRTWFALPARAGDQDELAEQMAYTGDRVAKFLADITRCRPTAGQAVVTGSSQGGSMAYLMASRHPQFVRGAVVVAGWLPHPLWNPRMSPTVGLHGIKDTTVPFDRTAAYVEAMQKDGAPLRFKIYDTGHVLSREMISDWRDEVNRAIQ